MAFTKTTAGAKATAATTKKVVTKKTTTSETVDKSARADVAACKKEIADLVAELEGLKTKLSACASGAKGTGLGQKFVQMMNNLK